MACPLTVDAGSLTSVSHLFQIWSCESSLPQQSWYYTDDDRVAVEGRGQCLDRDASGRIQTWACTTGNDQQRWTTGGGGSVNPPPPTPEPSPDASAIHPFGIEGLCVTVSQPFADGNKATVYPCNGKDSQNFEIQRGSGKIRMRADPSFCLDAGVEPHNNVDLKVRFHP